MKSPENSEVLLPISETTVGSTPRKPKSKLDPGQVFGRLTVLQEADHRLGKSRRYLCRCQCGKEKVVDAFNLINAQVTSCGCYKSEVTSARRSPEIPEGAKFGRWTYVGDVGSDASQSRQSKVICDCGTVSVVLKRSLLNGRSQSCGCLARERAKAASTVHGKSGTPLHLLWKRLKSRCCNPRSADYPSYGGRGVAMYSEWLSDASEFMDYVEAHLGPKPGPEYSLDRVDNSLGYIPGNIRWATQKTQANNTSRNVVVAFGGKSQTLSEWAAETGIDYFTLHSRIKRLGWDVGRALTTK